MKRVLRDLEDWRWFLKSFKSTFLALFFFTRLCANELSQDILSQTKSRSLMLQAKQNDARSSKLKRDWLNPIILSWKYKKDDNYKSKALMLHIDQPIFKSGGIYHAIKYANSMKEYGQSSLKITQNQLIKNAYEILFNIKKIDLSMQKQKFVIKNSKIDVDKKRELVSNGLLDSTFLNNAILDKNIKQNIMFDLELNRQTLINSFKNISDEPYTSFELPRLTLIEKEQFIDKNIIIKNSKQHIENESRFHNMTISKYLPSINVYYDKTKYSTNTNPMFANIDSTQSYGIKASIIFDTRTFNDVESAKVDYLKAKNDLIDKKIAEDNYYSDVIFRLDILDKKIALCDEDIELYSSLVDEFDEQFQAGLKTKDDLDMMKNSKSIKELDKKIFDMQKSVELLKLYEKI